MNKIKENIIIEKSFQFALKIVRFCEILEARNKNVISRQLLKSGTSIGANIRESQNSESIEDFIHKLKIAAKEASETEYWLMICQQSPNYPFNEELLDDIQEIIRIISKIIITTKKRKTEKNVRM